MPDQTPGPSIAEVLAATGQEPDYGYGFRYNSSAPKGLGYFGPLQRPTDNYTMSEYSMPLDEEHGDTREIPSIVPTLTRAEVQSILALPKDGAPSPEIQEKARAFARQRLAAGLPVFARPGEQQNLYPDLPRNPVPASHPQVLPMASHATPPMMPSRGQALPLLPNQGTAGYGPAIADILAALQAQR